jgi:exopolysaccharide production protein ExoY
MRSSPGRTSEGHDLSISIQAPPQTGDETSAASFYARHGKRCADVLLGMLFPFLALPVILLLVIAVTVTSGWPVFYAGRRIGKGGREFSMWKFRTMVRDADQELARWLRANPQLAEEFWQNFKLRGDPRITRVGRVLRKTSLDELPQLWNVVRGEMSLIGPRPIVAEELRHYDGQSDRFLSVRPGLTGAWQVNGRNSTPYPERVDVELDYINRVCPLEDARILLRTLSVPLSVLVHSSCLNDSTHSYGSTKVEEGWIPIIHPWVTKISAVASTSLMTRFVPCPMPTWGCA